MNARCFPICRINADPIQHSRMKLNPPLFFNPFRGFSANIGPVRVFSNNTGASNNPVESLNAMVKRLFCMVAVLVCFSIRRNGRTSLGRDLEIGNITLPLGTDVNTSLNIDLYRAGYSYSFFQDDRISLGIGSGLYVMPISFSLDASGLITESVRESFTAPLPVIGFRADFASTPKWYIRSRMDSFYLEIGKYR